MVGTRLDRVVVALVPELSRTYAKELISGGHVRVGGRPASKPGAAVEAAEPLEVRLAPRPRRDASASVRQLAVLYEDDDIAAIDKPAGVLVHPTGAATGGTVSELAVARYGPLPALQGEDRPGIVHRLDAGTSGVMLLARTAPAFAGLMAQFRAREVEKTYLALVWGEPRFDTGVIDTPIDRDEADSSRMAVASPGEGRDALTHYEVLERFRGVAWLACKPKSGRTHQIRVHLSSIGHALLGDRLYRRRGGPPVRLPDEAPIPPRQALHSARLRLRHPRSGAPLDFEAPLAPDIARMLAWLRAQPR
jgi:23S rRNA pseudouridine1911/1915/1917 synthase